MGLTLYSKGYTTDFDMSYFTFNRLREAIAKYVPSEPNKGTISFLEQCDCDGKLTHRECKELLEDIKDMPD